MKRNRKTSLALLGLFLWVTACTSYKQIPLADVADYDEVRVTLSGGERIVSEDVTVEGDSIHYWQKTDQSSQYSAVRGSSPLDQVVELEGAGAGPGPILVAVVVAAFVGALAYTAWYFRDW